MVKNLQCLKTLQKCYLRHAELHAKKRTSLRGLDHDTLFLNDPLHKSLIRKVLDKWVMFRRKTD